MSFLIEHVFAIDLTAKLAEFCSTLVGMSVSFENFVFIEPEYESNLLIFTLS